MDCKQLRYFLTICEQGSISKAAENLFISQQALSSSIGRLETELHVNLFYRTSKGVYPTREGIYLKEKAQQMISIEDHILQDIGTLRNTEPNLSLGCAYGVAGELAKKLVNRVLLHENGLQLKIREYTDLDCDKAVLKEEVDIGIGIGPVDSTLFESQLLLSRKCCFIAPSNHPLTSYKNVTVEHLAKEELIMLSSQFKVNHIFRSICKKHGIDIFYTFEAGEIAPISKLVQDGYGIGACIDFVANKLDPKEISIININEPEYRWDVYLIRKRDKEQTDAMRRFEAYMLDQSQASGDGCGEQ